MKNFDVEKIYADKMSGKNTQREQFQEMMKFVKDGDTLYVESFSRLSRSTKDLLETVQQLQDKKVVLVSDKEKLDPSTPQGKFMMTVFAAMSELERESILERQREGIEITKTQGKYKGRPAKISNKFIYCAKAWAKGRMQLKDAIAENEVSEATFFRRCKNRY